MRKISYQHIDVNLVKGALSNPVNNGNRSHFIADCPFCGKPQHLYVQKPTDKVHRRLQVNESYMWRCVRCDETGMLPKLLRKLNALHIVRFNTSINTLESQIENIISPKTQELVQQLPIIDETEYNATTIIGYRRIYSNQYLANRGFTTQHFILFEVGQSQIERKFYQYIIFPIYMFGKMVAAVGRRDDTFNTTNVRYNNTQSDFTLLLGGYDELIDDVTTTVILVEGYLDKINVSWLLKLYNVDHTKCCCTFGKKISVEQLALLWNKGVRILYFMYDGDALNWVKEKTTEDPFLSLFDIRVCVLPNNTDPGELRTSNDVFDLMDDYSKPSEVNINYVLNSIKN